MFQSGKIDATTAMQMLAQSQGSTPTQKDQSPVVATPTSESVANSNKSGLVAPPGSANGGDDSESEVDLDDEKFKHVDS